MNTLFKFSLIVFLTSMSAACKKHPAPSAPAKQFTAKQFTTDMGGLRAWSVIHDYNYPMMRYTDTMIRELEIQVINDSIIVFPLKNKSTDTLYFTSYDTTKKCLNFHGSYLYNVIVAWSDVAYYHTKDSIVWSFSEVAGQATEDYWGKQIKK